MHVCVRVRRNRHPERVLLDRLWLLYTAWGSRCDAAGLLRCGQSHNTHVPHPCRERRRVHYDRRHGGRCVTTPVPVPVPAVCPRLCPARARCVSTAVPCPCLCPLCVYLRALSHPCPVCVYLCALPAAAMCLPLCPAPACARCVCHPHLPVPMPCLL